MVVLAVLVLSVIYLDTSELLCNVMHVLCSYQTVLPLHQWTLSTHMKQVWLCLVLHGSKG